MREDEDDDVRGGPGWFATVIGAALLLAAGFAVGVVVGAVREEPAMVLQYVSGKTASVPAPVAREAAPAETPAAVEPAPAVEAPPPAARAVVVRVPDPEPAEPTTPKAGVRFAVQVGAFSQSAEAERLESALKSKGLPVYVEPSTGARESRWRVRVGPLASRAEADRVATKLKTQDKLPVWILEENGS